MKTMCPPGYHHNGFVANHALGHMTTVYHVPTCMSCHKAIVVITGRPHCFHDYIYIYIYIYIYNMVYGNHRNLTIIHFRLIMTFFEMMCFDICPKFHFILYLQNLYKPALILFLHHILFHFWVSYPFSM